eukprot:s4386_g2.t1
MRNRLIAGAIAVCLALAVTTTVFVEPLCTPSSFSGVSFHCRRAFAKMDATRALLDSLMGKDQGWVSESGHGEQHSTAQRRRVSIDPQDRNSAPDSKRQSFKDSDGRRCGTTVTTWWIGQWSLMLPEKLQLADGKYWQDTIFFSHAARARQDPDVCKYHLVGDCPHEMWVNQGGKASPNSPLLLHLVPLLLPVRAIHVPLCLGIYMGHNHDADTHLSLELSGLRISVSGPPDLVGEFVQFAASFRPGRARSPNSSVGSFEVVVTAPPASAPVSSGLETRDQIAATFRSCPSHLRSLGGKLAGGSVPGVDRIERAWTAGCWAKAVLDSRVHSPCRTPPIDIRSRCYAVVRAPSLDFPTIFRSSSSYWRAVGTFSDTNTSVSQSFPSESEARVYILAAGFSEEDIRVLP